MKRDWNTILAEPQASGASIKRFCEARGLSIGVFHYHKKRLKKGDTTVFIQVDIGFNDSFLIEICYPSGVRLKLSGKVHFEELSRLLDV